MTKDCIQGINNNSEKIITLPQIGETCRERTVSIPQPQEEVGTSYSSKKKEPLNAAAKKNET